MSKRIVLVVAGGVVAGATVIGVPAFAYASTGDSSSSNSTGMTGSQMSSMMNDPAFVDSAKQFMSKMMSDTQLQQQMRSVMGDMGDASGGMMGDSSSGQAAPSTP